MRDIPKLLDSRDPVEVKMCWDKLELLLREIVTFIEDHEDDSDGQASWSVGAFFSGAITVGQAVPRFLVPEDADGFVLTHLEVTYQAGTPSGDTEIDVYLRRGGADTLLGTSTLGSSAVADQIYSVALGAEVTLQEGDLIKWDCTATGDHEEVTAVVMGRQNS